MLLDFQCIAFIMNVCYKDTCFDREITVLKGIE